MTHSTFEASPSPSSTHPSLHVSFSSLSSSARRLRRRGGDGVAVVDEAFSLILVCPSFLEESSTSTSWLGRFDRISTLHPFRFLVQVGGSRHVNNKSKIIASQRLPSFLVTKSTGCISSQAARHLSSSRATSSTSSTLPLFFVVSSCWCSSSWAGGAPRSSLDRVAACLRLSTVANPRVASIFGYHCCLGVLIVFRNREISLASND